MRYKNRIIQGDCLELLPLFHRQKVDLVFGSPPYENARDVKADPFPVLKGEAWVEWMVQVVQESLKSCKGLVAYVMQGPTRNYCWSAVPFLLAADLYRVGICLRRPVIFQRYGVPGSGGKDWLKCNHEYVICATSGGKLPWSDNTACGHIPKYGPGGPCSNRKKDGSRINQWGHTGKGTDRMQDGTTRIQNRPSHIYMDPNKLPKQFVPPALVNPGDVVDCGAVGRGHMGNLLAHENEAPFPEKLAEFFIKSFCPPDGVVLDPFCGSFSTGAAAIKAGRNYIGFDVRASQVKLSERRINEAKESLQKL